MPTFDVLRDTGYFPTPADLADSIHGPARGYWDELIGYIEENYQATPKIAYSKCSGKPGWNMKYQKSGKAVCTLYPEPESFTVLVVAGKDLIPVVEARLGEFSRYFVELYQRCTMFNGTYWLMITVREPEVLEDVKRLFRYKLPDKRKVE